jgi:phosphoglycerate dehydrogenase-like enzyme
MNGPVVLVPRFLMDGFGSEVEAAVAGRAEIVVDDPPPTDEVLDAIDVVVTGIDDAVFVRAIASPSLRWVHSISAGVEHLPLAEMADRGIVLTNAAGAYASAMTEHALGGLLLIARGFPTSLAAQRDHRWLEHDAFDMLLLRGKRLGIVGYGAVGRELAGVAKALGMEVWATKRTPLFPSGEPLDRILPAAELVELLAASDVVVLAASLNRTTERLIGRDELAAMRPTAILVNVARGGLVDEDALVDALREGRLRGAVIDVTTREPLPPDDPLWTAPNLVITPHVSGSAPESWAASARFFCANLAVYLDGTPDRMGNVVDYDAVR